MKPVLFTLALLGCDHTMQAAPNAPIDAPADGSRLNPGAPGAAAPVMAPAPWAAIDADGAAAAGSGAPVLHCATAAYDPMDLWVDHGEDGRNDSAEVHRMVIAQTGDRYVATVHIGHPHRPADAVRTTRHELTVAELDDANLYLEWHGVSIYGWKDSRDVAFAGGAWGDAPPSMARPHHRAVSKRNSAAGTPAIRPRAFNTTRQRERASTTGASRGSTR